MTSIASAKFQPVRPLPDLSAIKLPAIDDVRGPVDHGNKLVSIRYNGEVARPNGRKPEPTQKTATQRLEGNSDWYEVKGGLAEAFKAAQFLSHDERLNYRSSTTIVQAGEGVYHLLNNQYPDSFDPDDIPALYSMPVDTIPAKDVDNSLPYGNNFAVRKVGVRFNDPDVIAVVGRDSFATPKLPGLR